MPIHRWGRFEGVLESAWSYEHPVHELDVKVEFLSPSGGRTAVRAFWDGGRSWRVRYCPDEPGLWQARTLDSCGDSGLARWRASFRCTGYQGSNPLYRHGAVRVAGSGRHLEHADGTPFFLLADTAWCGPMRSTPVEWDLYLADRATKQFSAVLFLPTQFRACAGTRDGRRAYTGRDRFQIDPTFYRHIDARVDAMNEAGLLAMPLLLHAGADTTLNVGHDLGAGEATLLARYMVARYGAHHVLWDFVAESTFQGDQAERWRQVGRHVFDAGIGHPVTLHPYGRKWVLDEFRDEAWMDVLGYQSAHNDDDGHWQWILRGPPSTDWTQDPPRPVINLEPPYEGHRAHPSGRPFDDYQVRRASYWSLLVSPPAGIGYGGHGVWGWDDGTQAPMAHPESGIPKPWRQALQLPGSTSMMHLSALMASIDWPRLRPSPDLVVAQPGRDDVKRTIVAACTERGDLALIYAPAPDAVELDLRRLAGPSDVCWIDPRRGQRHRAGIAGNGQWRGSPPGEGDWLLLLTSAGAAHS